MTRAATSTAKAKEKVFLVGIEMPDSSLQEVEVQMRELDELVTNLPYQIVGTHTTRLKSPQPNYLVGSGKVEEVMLEAQSLGAQTIVVDEILSPSQQRNWEQTTKLRVIDRQEIILEIFESRAQTKEAVLQVQLARLEYMLPRLKRAWTHLDRQRGGGVTQRGVGETQLQTDQRLVRDKIASLKVDLAEVRQHRAVQRKTRERIPLTTAAIVGYTNAGKSTLLNKLTGASVLAEDKLFATLDPTTRKLSLPTGQKLLVTDTVGFIRKLPTTLVEAFKATLEETVIADVLLHVVDISDPEMKAQRQTTLDVLTEIGATGKPIITVFNKVDCLPALANVPPAEGCCYISAVTGQGLPELMALLTTHMDKNSRKVHLCVPHNRYDVINLLHEAGGVSKQKATEVGMEIEGRLSEKLYSYFKEFDTKR